MADKDISGFEMDKTVEWYKENNIIVPKYSGKSDLEIEGREYLHLDDSEIKGLYELFPQAARDRALPINIIGKPSLWFHKESTAEKQVPTTNSYEAISKTAVIPSYIHPHKDENGDYIADIELYQIPEDFTPDDIKRIIHAQGFVHEVGHSLIKPALHFSNHNLKLPNGKIVNGLEHMLTFSKMAEKHFPISKYAGTFRNKNNTFTKGDKLAIDEAMAETITAYLLGFTYNGNEQGKNPFADRPEIREFTENFLNAKLVRD